MPPGPCPSRRRSRVDGWVDGGRRDPPSRPNSRQDQNAISSARVSPSGPPSLLPPFALLRPSASCILPLHHPVALFSSLLVTVCRPSPGLSFSSTPPRSFANFDLRRKTPLSFLDRHQSACSSSRPSTDRSPNQASRLALPTPRRITAARGRVIRSSRPANPSPTRQTHISISCNARLDCPLSSCVLCVCVCASTSRSCRDCGQQVSRGFPSGSRITWSGWESRLSFLQGPTIYCAARTVLPEPTHDFPSDLLFAEAESYLHLLQGIEQQYTKLCRQATHSLPRSRRPSSPSPKRTTPRFRPLVPPLFYNLGFAAHWILSLPTTTNTSTFFLPLLAVPFIRLDFGHPLHTSIRSLPPK